MEWIDIKNKRPEDMVIVVVYSAGTYYPPSIAYFEIGHGFTTVSGDRRSCWKVTHWMPLPENLPN